MKIKKNEVRRIVCNYVKANGPQTWKTLHKIVLIASGRNIEENWGSSYLDYVSNNSLLFPGKSDKRYLIQSHVDGLYHLIDEQ